jgi:hypothetical protein
VGFGDWDLIAVGEDVAADVTSSNISADSAT